MSLIFYTFVILGLLFYIYLIPAYLWSKKRDQLIDEMERHYSEKKFLKCPSCGVMNALQSQACIFCHKPLAESSSFPGKAGEPEIIPSTPQSKENLPEQKPLTEFPPQLPKIPVTPPKEKSLLDSFPYKIAWPLPRSSALISITAVYIGVIVMYAFFVGIYTLGKAGVKKVRETYPEMVRRHVESPVSQSTPSSPLPSSPARETKVAPMVGRTPTPLPSPTPLALSGSEEEQIVQLMLYLENKDWNIATQARKILVTKGKKAALALVKEIDHPDSMIRTHVICALGEIGEPETVPSLIQALRHEDALTVIQATTALGRIRAPGVVDALVQVLKHPDWRVRHAAIVALKLQGDPKAIQAIEPFQADANERIRTAAKEAVAALRLSLKKE